MSRPALAIGGVALIGTGVAIGLGWSTGFGWPSSAEQDSLVESRIDTVRLDVDSGDVDIRVGDVATTTVHQEFRYHGARPDDTFQVNGTELVLNRCEPDCSVDYDVVVPRGTAVTGEAKSGDITVEGLAATDVTVQSGDVRVLDGAGSVKVQTSSGDITVNLATPQSVHADANSGDVKVVVPQDHYRVQVQTSSGDQRIDIPTDPASTRTLDLRADSGDVTLTPA